MNAPTKLLLAALALFCLAPAEAAVRARTYDEARTKAGQDGIIIYLYGPDWNTRSNRMLHDFWESRELETAAGDAVLLAVPKFQNADNADPITSHAGDGLRLPGFSYCPRVVMLDAEGDIYADLHGTDDLGSDTKGEAGLVAVSRNIGLLRERTQLLRRAEESEGAERARLLSQVADMPLIPPPGIVERIRLADPQDRTGCLRRHEFQPREFLYKEMDTKDGFLKPSFIPDLAKIKAECTRIFSDRNYRAEDRQAVYNLLIGTSRRNGIVSQRLKTLIRANIRLAPDSRSAKAGERIMTLWGDAKPEKNAARIRKENRAGMRRYAKEKREEKRRESKSERNIRMD